MFERMHSHTHTMGHKNIYIKFAKGDAVPHTAAATQTEVECQTKAKSKIITIMIEMFFRSIFRAQ